MTLTSRSCLPILPLLIFFGCGPSSTPSNAAQLCSDEPCSGHGTCQSDGVSVWCVCAAGYHAVGGPDCVADGPCNGSTVNACGGCDTLPAAIGAPCGTCGTYQCSGTSFVCRGDTPNPCGGCTPLAHPIGSPCGTCGTWQCSGTDESETCSGESPRCGGSCCQPGETCVNGHCCENPCGSTCCGDGQSCINGQCLSCSGFTLCLRCNGDELSCQLGDRDTSTWCCPGNEVCANSGTNGACCAAPCSNNGLGNPNGCEQYTDVTCLIEESGVGYCENSDQCGQ